MGFERPFIRNGDSTTTNGVVQAPPSTITFDDQNVCFEGDPVSCPACKSIGITKCVPPFRPWTAPDGRQANLDGDLCLCRCPTSPRLVAKFHNRVMCFEYDEIVGMAGVSSWLAHTGYSEAITRFDQHFVIHDKASARPVKGFHYGIKTESGEHHDTLYEDGATAKAYAQQAQTMTMTYLVQTTIGVRE